MNQRSLKLALLTATLACIQVAPVVGQVQFIQNGGFETGDFSFWAVSNSGNGAWTINDGSFNPAGPGGALPPIAGNFDIVSNQGGPGLHIVSECFRVPTNVKAASISWSDRIRNWANRFSDPNQEWRVWVLDAAKTPLFELFSTNPGDPLVQVGPNPRAFDVTTELQALEGQLICLSFEQRDNLSFFNATLDNVSAVVISCLVIDGCDSGVIDRELPDGSLLSSLVDPLVADCTDGAKNHGQFVSCFAQGLNDLVSAGIITEDEKDALQSCAGESSIGKKSKK